MNKPFLLLLLVLCLSLVAFQCEEDVTELTKEEEQKELSLDKKIIEDLAAISVCNEATVCKYIGLGSKPCGSFWSFLVYSTSIDVIKLESLVEDYNKKEAEFNQKWGVFSDCALANPPTSVICENNKCIAVY